MKNKTVEYNYLSPDGFVISADNFPTIKEANIFLNSWIKGFERQGYYSSLDGRISINELVRHCEFVKLKN